jgi:tRNA-2-methylthio-N6-dimethylallyladenosine synthase
MVITTDIIVGFPGETEQDFAMTMQLLEEVQFDGIFAFKYSKRPGTAALALSDHLNEDVKEQRLDSVLKLQQSITKKKHDKLIGTIHEILVEGSSKKGSTLAGRTRGNKVVNVAASADLIGKIVPVTITSAGLNSLSGKLCE